MAFLNAIIFSCIAFVLWYHSCIGDFTTGLLEGCVLTLAASFVLFTGHEYDRDKEMHKREMKQVSKAEGRQEVSSDDVYAEFMRRMKAR